MSTGGGKHRSRDALLRRLAELEPARSLHEQYAVGQLPLREAPITRKAIVEFPKVGHFPEDNIYRSLAPPD